MRQVGRVVLLAVVLVLAGVEPGHAWSHGPRTRIFLGPATAPDWGPGQHWPYTPYTYDVLYLDTPAGPAEAPHAFVQQAVTPSGYWYYCPSAGAYYPSVPACAEPWVKVPPR